MDILFLSAILPWIVVVAFVLICFIPLFWIRAVRRIPFRVLTLLIIIHILALWIRFAWVPNDHRIYFDEDRYLSYAASFARYGKALSLDLATPTRPIIGVPDEAGRVSVPVLNAISMKIFGFSEQTLFLTAKIVHSMAIPGIFLLGYLLFGSVAVGLLSALGVALIPTIVFFSPSFGLDLYFMDIAILTFITVLVYAKYPSLLSGLWLFASVIILTCVRIEAFVLLPVLLASYVGTRKSLGKNVLIKKDLWLYISILIYLIIRSLASLSVFTKPWCCAEALPLEAFSLSYLSRHMLPNLLALFTRVEFPWIISLTAFYALFVSSGWQTRVLGLWIGMCFLTYSAYYAGLFFNPEFSGSYGRYLLIIIPPLLILSSNTIVELCMHRRHILRIAIIVIIALSLIPTILRYPKLITYSPWDRMTEGGPRIIHTFLTEEILPKTPPNAIIIHNLTAPIVVAGKTAVFTGSFLEDPSTRQFVTDALTSKQPVFMLPNYRCLLFKDACKDLEGLYRYETFLKRDFGDNAILELQQLSLPN